MSTGAAVTALAVALSVSDNSGHEPVPASYARALTNAGLNPASPGI
jgi:hypothetical protein